ncbi:MAG: DUF4397 domain-containing protein [Myxococcota bacterium]
MNTVRLLVPLMALSLGMVACNDDTSDTSDATDGTDDTDVASETAKVRLVHLGVFPGDTGTDVDIFVNGEASGVSLAFKDTTDYVELDVGTYTFDIVPKGGAIGDSVFTVADFDLEADTTWSFVASGYAAGAGEGDAAFNVTAFEDNGGDVPAGKTRLNVFHKAGAAALNPVDVWVVDASCTPVGDAPLLAGFAYNAEAPGVDLDPGALGVGFDVGANATVDACFQVPDLGADVFVNVYAVNTSAGVPSLVAHLPDGTSAEVQAVAN